MGFSENTDYRHSWINSMRRNENMSWGEKPTPPPLKVENPEVLKGIQQELNYIYNLEPVKKGMEYADRINISLQRGAESRRALLPHTPRINIDFTRNPQKNIVEKVLTFQRDAKNCQFIFTNTPEGETMNIGKNNLDKGYNEAIQGWVSTGMKLLKDAIEQDHYTPTTSTEVTYSDGPTTSTEQQIIEDAKGPMEI